MSINAIFILIALKQTVAMSLSAGADPFYNYNNSFMVRSFINFNWSVFDIAQRRSDLNEDLFIPQKNPQQQVMFRIDQNTAYQCGSQRGQVVWKNDTECVTLAGPVKSLNNWTIYNNGSQSSIRIRFNPVPNCPFVINKDYWVIMDLICNETDNSYNLTFDNTYPDFDIYNCTYYTKAYTKLACPIETNYSLERFFSEYCWLCGLTLILAGFYFTLLGVRFLYFTVYFLGCNYMVAVTTFFFSLAGDVFPSYNYCWALIVVGNILGFILSYYMVRNVKMFIIFTGAYTGNIVGHAIYQMIDTYISNPELIFYLIVISFCFVGALFSLKFFKHILIVGISMTGAASLVYGFSMYTNIIPPENYIFTLTKRKELSQLDELYGIETTCLFILFIFTLIFGMVFQTLIQNEKMDDMDNSKNIHEMLYIKILNKLG